MGQCPGELWGPENLKWGCSDRGKGMIKINIFIKSTSPGRHQLSRNIPLGPCQCGGDLTLLTPKAKQQSLAWVFPAMGILQAQGSVPACSGWALGRSPCPQLHMELMESKPGEFVAELSSVFPQLLVGPFSKATRKKKKQTEYSCNFRHLPC